MLLVPLDLRIEPHQTERISLGDWRDRIQRYERLDRTLPNMVRRHDGRAQQSIFDDLDGRSVDLGLGLEVEDVDVPGVPVNRSVFEENEAGGSAFVDEFAVELRVEETRDAAFLGDGDGEGRVGEDEAVSDRTSWEEVRYQRRDGRDKQSSGHSPRAGATFISLKRSIEVAQTI